MPISRHRVRVFDFFDSLKEHWFTSDMVSHETGVAPRTARLHIQFLEENKIIERMNTVPRLYRWNHDKKDTKTEHLIQKLRRISQIYKGGDI